MSFLSIRAVQPVSLHRYNSYIIQYFTKMTETNTTNENATSRMMEEFKRRLIVLENVLCAGKEVLTLEEAAMFMGISRSTLYKMTHNSVIPFYRPNGKLIYFEKSLLLEWMRKNRASSTEEIDENARLVLQNMACK